MPTLEIEDLGVPAVASFGNLLKDLLDEAAASRPAAVKASRATNIEPPLNQSDLNNLSERVAQSLSTIAPPDDCEDEAVKTQAKARQFAAVEAVARDVFAKLTASTPIDSPEFVTMWNFLDILSLLSDSGQCEPALLFWLIEELLDAQTIAGCRIIFDYLESRRERITAKHFKQTNLVILRSCNELLRRLSRAEDTAFCGRVFIFLFQSFPLGDRSSVNLRGEYHVENVTSYEPPAEKESKMDVDVPEPPQQPAAEAKDEKKKNNKDAKKQPEPLSVEELYDLFWPLQESFSQPLTLFNQPAFTSFQRGVEETVKKFRTYPSDEGSRPLSTLEEPKQNLKRKRDGTETDEQSEAFNPKYLTSKDLFELEIGDLTFRRHILVQILIILNFVLSWTADAKKKYEKMETTNRSVMYPGEFSEEQAKWAKETKSRIADYMRRDTPGKIFHRMVDTVLARDKNWVYWKMAGCPPIQRDSVGPHIWAEAQASAQRMTTNKRLRPIPMNAVPMEFLEQKDIESVMNELKDPKRFQVPDLDEFKAKISDSDFEISMAANEQAKAQAVANKASKSWRAMRIARGFKLAAFDKVDDPNDISAIFEPLEDIDAVKDVEDAAAEEDMPTNRETVVISGPSGVGKSALIEKLLELHQGVFGRVVRHTTREPADGEVNGKTYHFVKAQEFNQLRDGDRLIEYTEEGDIAYGTSSKALDAVLESGKVPVIELSIEAAKFAKDMMDFPARYIFLTPPTPDALQSRLKEAGNKDDAAIQAIIDGLASQTEDTQVTELFNKTFVNEDLEEAGKAVGEYLFEKDGDEEMKEEDEDENEDEPKAETNGEEAEAEAEAEAANGGDQMEVEAETGSDSEVRDEIRVEQPSEQHE